MELVPVSPSFQEMSPFLKRTSGDQNDMQRPSFFIFFSFQVEKWLLQVEEQMVASLRDVIKRAVREYKVQRNIRSLDLF